MTMKKEKGHEREAVVAKNCLRNSTFAIQDTRGSVSEPRALQYFFRELEKFHGSLSRYRQTTESLDSTLPLFRAPTIVKRSLTSGLVPNRLGRFIFPISIAKVGISWDVSSSAV
jgi:hypothetical protein